uniref:oligosaccharide flippase family protein n=1 Tax=Pseudoalteromonas sp. MQS005 TaxID=1854052 RepID=UPI0007E51A30
MIEKLIKLKQHSVIKNSFALFLLQLVNMVAPLMILPFLSRALGIEGFGIFMLVMSASLIGVIISDYGFTLSGTYQISRKREDHQAISKIIGAILTIKIILVLGIFIALLIMNNSFLNGSYSNNLIILVCLNVLAQAMIPTWFFQGIENMKRVTIYMVCAKLFYIVLVLGFVDNKDDVELVVLFLCLSNVLAMLIALYSIYSCNYSIAYPDLNEIKKQVIKSTSFFLSRAAVSLYTTANTFIVGAFSGVQQAAIFGASEKLYLASQSFTSPIAQALFPYVAKNKSSGVLFKILPVILVPLISGSAIVVMWSNEIMVIIFGEQFSNSGGVLQIFICLTSINFISVIFGYPAFAAIGRVSVANYTVIFGAFIHLIVIVILAYIGQITAENVIRALLFTEVMVLISRILLFY